MYTLVCSIESVIIPGQIGGIDESSFENCNKLNKVTITKGLRFIDDYAFFECKALKEIKLPEGLQSIGVGAFYRTGIKQLTIPGCFVCDSFFARCFDCGSCFVINST